MALPEAFWEQLPQKSDVELYEVLLQRHEYLPEALAAVEEEMRKRNLSPKKLAEIAASAAQSRLRAAEIRADERHRRHHGKLAVHVFTWLAIPPLVFLMKWLLSLLMGPE
jgi:hypothetical protein